MGPGCSPHLRPHMPDCLAAGSGAPESCPELRAAPKLGPVPCPLASEGQLAEGMCPALAASPKPAFCPEETRASRSGPAPTTQLHAHLQWAGLEVRVAGGPWGSCLLPLSTHSP